MTSQVQQIVKYHYKTKKVDIEDFCDVVDCEFISEDGLTCLMRHVYEMARDAWEFVDCVREDKNPWIIHLRFRREA